MARRYSVNPKATNNNKLKITPSFGSNKGIGK